MNADRLLAALERAAQISEPHLRESVLLTLLNPANNPSYYLPVLKRWVAAGGPLPRELLRLRQWLNEWPDRSERTGVGEYNRLFDAIPPERFATEYPQCQGCTECGNIYFAIP